MAERVAARDCAANSSDLVCRLDRYLNALDIIAMVLGAILVIVVAIALILYRKNKISRSRLP